MMMIICAKQRAHYPTPVSGPNLAAYDVSKILSKLMSTCMAQRRLFICVDIGGTQAKEWIQSEDKMGVVCNYLNAR